MPLTLDEIVEHEERLRREIVERECLLAAFKVLHGHVANGHGPKSLELGSLISALHPSRLAVASREQTPDLPAATPAPPSPPPPKPYIHPELEAIGSRFGHGSKIVRWAIQRMTDDYSLGEIAALLKREGEPMRPAKISVVLTRLKGRGEIEEMKPGGGRRPAIFRKPGSATSPETMSPDPVCAKQ